MIDPNDPEQLAEHGKRRRARATQEQQDMQAIAALPEGQRLLQRIFTMTGRDAASYVPGDALGTAYREGQRSIGIQLTAMLARAMK